MDKPAMIRSFFDKIEKVSAAPVTQMAQVPAAVAQQSAVATAMPAAAHVSAPAAVPTSAPVYESIASLPPSFNSYSFNHGGSNSEEYNPDCPPLTSIKGHTARARFDDFGVGLPPMAGSNS